MCAVTTANEGVQQETPLNYLQSFDFAPSPLAANATETSSVIDLMCAAGPGFGRWRLFVFSDQSGSVSLEQSSDGTTFYPTLQSGYTADGTAAIYESLVALRYLRAVYVNGDTDQTEFRLLATLVAI